jgi:myxalamid-type polyketide synthase MxaB
LDNLKLQPLQRRAPGAGEVEIEVQAAGLNFRDVLNAMGMYPGDPGPLGGECAGVVVQCGADVHDLRVGDRVMALAPASFSSYVTTARAFVLPLPEALSFADGATIPAAFLTASYALRHLAQLRAGERVLIHAAAGGVGLAAVQLAQQLGAEVYATASVGKWEQLRALGVKHIANSRTLEFEEQVLEWSDGEGVDVVLNSLAGDYIAKSVAVLKRDGRFVELGKRGIWDVEQVRAQKPEARYYSFDLGAVAVGEPALLRQLFEQVGEEVQQGRLRPLLLQEFGIEQVVDAFRHMAQAKHVGKVVLRVARETAVDQDEALSFSGEGSYLITGGKSGLGLLVAQWLVERGARHLILLGRQPASAQALQTIEQLRAMGVSVRLVEADVVDRAALERVFSELKEDGLALRGVVHSAGVLEDGVLLQQDWGQFFRVLRTKAEGAWHLHELSLNQTLDFFVLFSSAAAVLGSPGQGNHAAANAFLDGLAQQRRAAGLAGLSINWGAWSEVGAAAARHVDQRMQLSGLGSIAPQQGLATLERVWRSPHAQVAVLPVQWEAFLEQYSGGMRPPFLTEVSAGVDQRSKQRSEFRQRLMSAPESERYEMLREHVREQVAKVLGMREGQWPDVEQGFFELGMDSLTSLELKNRLQASLEVTLPATLIFDAPNIQALSRYLAQEVLDLKTSSEAELAPAPVFNDPQEENLLQRIQHLSDDEVIARINAELETVNDQIALTSKQGA